MATHEFTSDYSTLELYVPQPGLEVHYGSQRQNTDLEADYAANAPIPAQIASQNIIEEKPLENNNIHPDPIASVGSQRWRLTSKRLLAVITPVIVIAAIIGGVAGGIMAHRSSGPASSTASASSNGDPQSSTLPTPSTSSAEPSSSGTASEIAIPNILEGSKLSAINFTDMGNTTQYNAVFWQDRFSNLAMSIWDSSNQSWATINITGTVTNNNLAKAKPGSPLAALAQSWPMVTTFDMDFSLSLFYIDVDNIIQHISSPDLRGTTWSNGSLTSSSTKYTVNEDSGLGTWWQGCNYLDECYGDMLLYFQDTSGFLQLANSSDWTVTKGIGTSSGSLMSSSGIGASALYISPGGCRLRVYVCQEDDIEEWDLPVPQTTWIGSLYRCTCPKAHPTPLAQGLSAAPQLSVISFAANSNLSTGIPTDILLAQIYSNNTLLANHWDDELGQWGGNNAIQVDGQSITNVTAVSLATDLTAYLLTSGNQLQQYTFDRSSPQVWTYKAQIYTNTTT